MATRPKTLFVDIDGTLLFHHGDGIKQALLEPLLLPGVYEKFNEWDRKGYMIILTTGRRESERRATEKQLHSVGIVYDHLIMGIGGGKRIIINDTKPHSDDDTAGFVCVKRNEGIINVDI